MHPRPFSLQFHISQTYFLIFLRASLSAWPPAGPDLVKEITEKHRWVLMKRERIFDNGILMMWQGTNSDWNSHKYADTLAHTHTHTHRQNETPGNDGSWLSVGKEGAEGTEDATSQSFNVKFWHFYEACFENGQIQIRRYTHSSRNRYVWLNPLHPLHST